MSQRRDMDGRLIIDPARSAALERVLQLRDEALAAGDLPFPMDWPLPPCLVCGATTTEYLAATDPHWPTRHHFYPCGHGVVADSPPHRDHS
jgi:hypothetical protein